MVKIYIAGSLLNYLEIMKLQDILKKHEHTITEDWASRDEEFISADESAKINLKGIDECDVFVMYLDQFKSSGKIFEFGYAEALKKPILIYGSQVFATSIYYKLPALTFCEEIDDLLKELKECE